jgi:hypothetical protein
MEKYVLVDRKRTVVRFEPFRWNAGQNWTARIRQVYFGQVSLHSGCWGWNILVSGLQQLQDSFLSLDWDGGLTVNKSRVFSITFKDTFRAVRRMPLIAIFIDQQTFSKIAGRLYLTL